MKIENRRDLGRLALAAALLGLLLTAIRAAPPAPREAHDEDRFSAIAARQLLDDLYADVGIHPIGTDNNRRLKERILDHLRHLGYQPAVQSTMACRESGGCGQVENIVARLAGTGTGKAVLLAVHYDGVGAGPSIADDGVAVAAVLEIARILKSGPPLRNDVIFLIDDGEEAFLLGAVAFAAKHPWAEDVGAVVNLEARGSGGRSYMFETGTDNAWLIELMKQGVPRPATSSVFYSVYQRLPNDTDFTVFRYFGMNGVNFAFIGDVVHYHTPLDDLAHASSASLQHHGDNALGMARALANADLESPPVGTASWFDLWGFAILSWPESWNLPLSITSLILVSVVLAGLLRRRLLTTKQLRWGLLLYPAALFSALILALVAAWILRSLGNLPDWPAVAWVPRAAFWLIGVAAGARAVTLMGRKSGVQGAWFGAIVWSAVLAAALSVVLPGAAYIFLVTALLGSALSGLAALWTSRVASHLTVTLTVFFTAAAQLILAWSLWDAMGLLIMPVVTLLIAAFTTLVLTPFAETVDRTGRRLPLAGLVAAGLLIVLSLFLPPYSMESPRPLNFYFVQNADEATARMAVRPRPRPLPDPLAAAVEWQADLERFYPWSEDEPSFVVADAQPLQVAPPVVEILESTATSTGRRIRARLSSPRGADRGALVFSDSQRIASLHLAGWEYDLQTEEIRAWYPDRRRVVRFATMPEEGIEFEVALEGREPFTVYAIDSSYGLPPSAAPLIEARPAEVVPIHRGDQTVVHTRAVL